MTCVEVTDRLTFLRFVAASGVAAAISISVVALIGRWVDMSLTGWHVLVVAIAYFFAARINFELQRRWVFKSRGMTRPPSVFVQFLVVNGSVSLLVASLSALFMKWSWLLALTGKSAPLWTLMLAAIASAPVSFLMTRKVIARPPANRESAPCAS